MKQFYIFTYLFMIILFSMKHIVTAQERIQSLSLKQYEIESKIREKLSDYLQPKDYTIKVTLEGKRDVFPSMQGETFNSSSVRGGLPGFEAETVAPSITSLVGETYWKIDTMKINLVVHKKISASVYDYIQNMIPIISGLDISRGDIFEFKTIRPNQTEKLGDVQVEGDENQLTQPTLDTQENKKWYNLSPREWIFIALLGLLFLLLFLFWRKNNHLNQSYKELQSDWEENEARELRDTDKSADKIKEEIIAKRKEREQHIENTLLLDKNSELSQEVLKELLGREDWSNTLIEKYTSDKSGVEKLKQFFSILGANSARKLFLPALGKERYLELEEMSKDIHLKPNEEYQLLKEIRNFLSIKRIQFPEKVNNDPFKFLQLLSKGQIAFLIKDEPTKIKAIVISRLEAEMAASIIEKLNEQEKSSVVLELGKMEEMPLDLIENVAYDLANKAKDVPDNNTVSFDGVDMVVEVMGNTDSQTRKELIQSLRVGDIELSNQVESKFFLFESIPLVSRDILTQVVRKIPSADVIVAISGADKKLQEHVILCFPENLRATLVSSLKSQKPNITNIKEKRKEIIRGIQKMAADNKIDLKAILNNWEKMEQAS